MKKLHSDLKHASAQLKPLLSDSDEKRWPVLHVPLYANTFPLAYVYYRLLLKKTTPKDRSLEDWVRTDPWGRDLPKLERKARFNLFIATRSQITNWRAREHFQAYPLFAYEHKFVLADRIDNSPITTLPEWAKAAARKVREFRIVTDIPTEADALRVVLATELSKLPKPPHVRISVVQAEARTQHEILRNSFGVPGLDAVRRLYLFGTPVSEVLKRRQVGTELKYSCLDYPGESRAFLCVYAVDPEEEHMAVSSIYAFFAALKYPTANSGGIKGGPVGLGVIAEEFCRCLETRLPGVDMSDFKNVFTESITNHSFLVDPSEACTPWLGDGA